MTSDSKFNQSSEAASQAKKSLLKPTERHDSKELREASDAGRAAYTEAVGFDESAEVGAGVSEIMSGNKDQSTGGTKGKTAQTARKPINPNDIRDRILKNLPKEPAMRSQIEDEIRKEIRYLHKKAMKMVNSPGKISYFEMSNIMKKIRELKGILAMLAKATLESLKTLWLRFVHGVM